MDYSMSDMALDDDDDDDELSETSSYSSKSMQDVPAEPRKGFGSKALSRLKQSMRRMSKSLPKFTSNAFSKFV